MQQTPTSTTAEQLEVLRFWFGAIPAPNLPADAIKSRWFVQSDDFDVEIRRRFGVLVERALAGGLADWESIPRGRLALIVLLDQFPRNLYRGDARAFAGDSRALALADEAVGTGVDRQLTLCERSFLYLPFEHSEDPRMQVRSVACFRALADDAPAECRGLYLSNLEYAERHKLVIDRFGRFPHRNTVLVRSSTAEEHAHLARNPGGF